MRTVLKRGRTTELNRGNVKTTMCREFKTKLNPSQTVISGDFRLLEDEFFRLLENGDFRLLE